MIKAVIFDVDGVLINSLEANHSFFTDLMKKFGYGFMGKDEYKAKYFHRHMRDMVKHSAPEADDEEVEKIWKAGKDREVPYPNHLVGAPESLQGVIESLSKKYILGIVSSRSNGSIFSVPVLTPMEKFFKAVVAYDDTKEHKPDPEPMFLLLEKLGLKGKNCVYVGDSATDITAAHAAGMKAILYSTKPNSYADANITEFSKLEVAIENL